MGFLAELRAVAAALRGAPLPPPQSLRRPVGMLVLPGSEIDANPMRTKHDQLEAAVGWVYAAATTLAQDVRAAEWALWRRTGRTRAEWTQVEQSPVLDTLERPNALMTWGDLIELTDLHMSLTGEAYWHLLGDVGGRIRGVELLYPHWVTEPLVRDGRLAAWRVQVPGRSPQDLPADDVVGFRFPHPTMPLAGMSPVEAFAVSHVFDLYVRAYGAALFRNDGGVPAGLLTSDHELSPEQADLIRERWAERYSRRWGEVAVLGKGARYQQLAIPMADVDILAWGQFSRDQILAVYKVPAAKLGLLAGEGVSRANLEAADVGYKELALRPRLQRYQEAINIRLLPRLAERGDAGRLWFEFSNPVTDDLEARAKLLTDAIRVASAAPNELRDVLGLDPWPDGDVRLVPASTLPVTSLRGAPTAGQDDPGGEEDGARADALPPGVPALPAETTPATAAHAEVVRAEETLELVALRFLQRQTALERGLASQVRALFSREQRVVIAAMRRTPGRAVEDAQTRDMIDDALRGTATDWERMLARFWLRGMQAGWLLAVPQLGDRQLPWTAIQVQATEFAQRMGALKVRGIQDLTRAKIRQVVARGVAEGHSVDQVARALRALYDGFKGARALTIARTETAQAVNRGHWLHAKAVQRRQGVQVRKQWVATNDGRTRPTHAEAHRQTVPLDEAFTVGGHALLHPGDPGGPAEEVANCRCTTVLLFPDEEVPA